MASYEAWNRAIIGYLTAGVPKGSPVFLSLDAEAIEEMAAEFLEESADADPLLDFRQAVRRQCVSRNSLRVDGLTTNIGNFPGGVGFLGLMVLAAYNMQDEEGIDESNYFLRLREVLDLPQEKGRPDGLRAGTEEPLWKAWNKYLAETGFQATAERGAGPQIYLRYVMSQAILRESDKQYLRQRFHENNLPPHFDCDQLGFWLSRQSVNRRHLFEGLHHPDQGRVWEFYRAAHRVYETGDWAVGAAPRISTDRFRVRNIECGLYRTEDLLGEPQYWLFPRQPARTRSSQLAVTPLHRGNDQPLRPFRPGFFAPLWPHDPFVEEALECSVVGDPAVSKLLFPRRDFWLLMRDPEIPHGAWATWKPYLELGEKLLVLCREGPFDAEMNRFKDEKLLDWTDRVALEGYIEYHGCMVLSYDWGGFIGAPECRALADALTPRTMAGISLLGGLRDPNQNAWLEGFPPVLKVYGFERHFELVVTSAHGGIVFREEVPRQQEITLPQDLGPDTYQTEVKWNGKRVAMRMFRVTRWANIQEHPEPDEITNRAPISTAGLSLRGALIVQDTRDGKGVPYA
jgi:hypothetical protein